MPSRFLNLLVLLLGTAVLVALGFGPWILALGLAVFAILFGLTLVSTRRVLGLYARSPGRRREMGPDDAAPFVRDRWAVTGTALRELGFEWLGGLERDLGPGVPTETMGTWHGEDDATFVSYVVHLRDRSPAGEALYATTWFRDGTVVETCNLPIGRAVDARHDLICLPGLEDAGTLVAVHRRRLSLAGEGRDARERFAPAAEVTAIHDFVHTRHREADEAAGNLRLRADGDGYVPTLRGVARTAIRHVWPVSALLRIAERRRAEAFLRAIGLAEPGSTGGPFRWAAAAAGFGAAIAGAWGSLGLACWTFLGIAAAAYMRRRGGRPFGLPALLAGGASALVAFVAFAAVATGWPWRAGRPGVAPFGVLENLIPATLFLAGAAALYWGWSGIPYLDARPAPSAGPPSAASATAAEDGP